MNKPEKCKNCQWYGKPYWSIINPCDSCSSNEETTLVYKINMPMFQDGELERFDDNIHNISSEFVKMHLKEKDMILSQRLVAKLEEENEKYKEVLDKIREYCNKRKKKLDTPYDIDRSARLEIVNILELLEEIE